MNQHEQIAILDFGSQYTHLIARRLRECSVLAKIYPHDVLAKTLQKERLIGIILSGGPRSVYDKNALAYDSAIFDLKVPILGLCYGHQLIADHFGGVVKTGRVKEFGFAKLTCITHNIQNTPLFQGLPRTFTVWMSHGDTVTKLPPKNFITIARTPDCDIAAMMNHDRNIYGLQFHPEVYHTKDDNKILRNFAFAICHAKADWEVKHLISKLERSIREIARNKKVCMLISGGVDSTVAYALLTRALGENRVIGLHIDSGLMRKRESETVVASLKRAGFKNLVHIKAETLFLERLKDVASPEKKRKIIGETYLDVAEEWWSTHIHSRDQMNWLLGQGTIYPDIIESGGSKHAEKIKTHHNRIARITQMIERQAIIEPLKDLYKDEVRKVGKVLRLPLSLLRRHPFPGPGFAIRILCSGRTSVPKHTPLPYNALLLPLKSTGVQGDRRTYAQVACVGNVTSLTNWSTLEKFSTKLTNEHHDINRVVSLVWRRNTTKERTAPTFYLNDNVSLTPEILALLRDIDAKVMDMVKAHNVYNAIWQFPVVLLPVGLTKHGLSIALRPFSSQEVMTATFYPLRKRVLDDIIKAIAVFPAIDAIFYDITHKPPATVEWE